MKVGDAGNERPFQLVGRTLIAKGRSVGWSHSWSAACCNRTRGDENEEPRDRTCASRGSAHVEERYLPCVDGSRRLCGAPDRDVKYGDAVTAKEVYPDIFNSGRRYFWQA